MARSILLRGFDQQMAEMIGSNMHDHGTKFIRGAIPSRIEKISLDGVERLKVFWTDPASKKEVSVSIDIWMEY